jgi:putative chitinase
MSVRDLIDAGVSPTQAKLYAGPLTTTMERFAITTLPQRAAFIAQCMHESGNFTRLEESLWYSTPERIALVFGRLRAQPAHTLLDLCKNPRALANAAYGSMNGNRGPATDDGWRYRGSGLIQLTGRNNFERAQSDSGRPYVEQPELVRTNPDDAALTAGLFWLWNNCNRIMDEGDFDGLSKVINLGNRRSGRIPNGNAQRQALYARVTAALLAAH